MSYIPSQSSHDKGLYYQVGYQFGLSFWKTKNVFPDKNISIWWIIGPFEKL